MTTGSPLPPFPSISTLLYISLGLRKGSSPPEIETPVATGRRVTTHLTGGASRSPVEGKEKAGDVKRAGSAERDTRSCH